MKCESFSEILLKWSAPTGENNSTKPFPVMPQQVGVTCRRLMNHSSMHNMSGSMFPQQLLHSFKCLFRLNVQPNLNFLEEAISDLGLKYLALCENSWSEHFLLFFSQNNDNLFVFILNIIGANFATYFLQAKLVFFCSLTTVRHTVCVCVRLVSHPVFPGYAPDSPQPPPG